VTVLRVLDPRRYLPVKCDALTAVGWLARDSRFETGSMPDPFFSKLSELCDTPWQPMVPARFHVCALCQFDGPHFSDNLFVLYSGQIYVSPVGIVHYVAAHWVPPPANLHRRRVGLPADREHGLQGGAAGEWRTQSATGDVRCEPNLWEIIERLCDGCT
jgi:hypothetical protein